MNNIGCPVCSNPLSVRTAEGRKSHKAFIMLVCDKDPRHFRGFITDQEFIKEIMERKTRTVKTKKRLSGIGGG
jgi:uncharacterized protein YbaR (Trm112 family)